jgi:23S rRNA pseudouridine1911/1915/1917 synthase
VLRKYHAVVHGYPEAQSIDTILVRNRGDGHRGTKPKSDASPTTDAKPVVDVSSIVDSSSAMDGKSAVDTESSDTESGDTESGDTESGGGGKQADPTEQRAITHIRPIEKIGPYSLIECQLETGRTHQIRIHLSEAGHLLCGDAIYCKLADGRLVQDQSGAPRQALHSATLSFQHPISEEKLEFKMPWPADLHRWLSSLRQIHSKQ